MTDPAQMYRDEDLVYVDPDERVVVGIVEWSKNGNPKSRSYVEKNTEAAEGTRKRGGFRKFYPWGTYRSMKRMFRLEGKQGKKQPDKNLDQVIPLALEQPFWD